MTQHRLTPHEIAAGELPLALVDLVSSGSTFEVFVQELESWAEHASVDIAAVRRRLRIIGITWRRQASPNTFRWHQGEDWLCTFPRIIVKNVSVPGELWNYLGDVQPKVSLSHPPWRWGKVEFSQPPRHEDNLAALTQALRVYDLSRNKEEREAFSSELTRQPAMSKSWLRTLVNELRTG